MSNVRHLMKHTSPKTSVERVSGSLATESALTLIAAIAGGPLAPLLPVLAKSLAAGRQQRRVEATLIAIQQTLTEHSEALSRISDEQYKLINEVVLAVLQTTQQEKLDYLRNAIRHSLSVTNFSAHEAVAVSRIIRDISAEEAALLIRLFAYEGIQLVDEKADKDALSTIFRLSPSSPDATQVTGLLSLGLLLPPQASWDGVGVQRFTKLAAKAIALLRAPDA